MLAARAGFGRRGSVVERDRSREREYPQAMQFEPRPPVAAPLPPRGRAVLGDEWNGREWNGMEGQRCCCSIEFLARRPLSTCVGRAAKQRSARRPSENARVVEMSRNEPRRAGGETRRHARRSSPRLTSPRRTAPRRAAPRPFRCSQVPARLARAAGGGRAAHPRRHAHGQPQVGQPL